MKTLKTNIVTAAMILLGMQNLFAQTGTFKEQRKAQVTFAYPIGSAGNSSLNYVNNFSFNVLYGMNGGVKGFELGSLWNHNNGDVKGFQLSGMLNTTTGNSRGLIISGLANLNNEAVTGVSISGLLNHSRQSLRGLQLAGIANIGQDSLRGVAISGILNLTNDFEGVQIGLVNQTSKANGVQIGLINISEEGKDLIPVGFINSIKNNGYYELDLSWGEAIFSNLSYKMGVERWFTILKIGYSVYQAKPLYSWGGGFGTSIMVSERQRLNIEITSNKIVFDNNWEGDLSNGLNKLDLNYKFTILNKFSLLFGPSFNVYLTKEKINGEYGTINIPYTIYEHENADKKLFLWIGLNAGISVKF